MDIKRVRPKKAVLYNLTQSVLYSNSALAGKAQVFVLLCHLRLRRGALCPYPSLFLPNLLRPNLLRPKSVLSGTLCGCEKGIVHPTHTNLRTVLSHGGKPEPMTDRNIFLILRIIQKRTGRSLIIWQPQYIWHRQNNNGKSQTTYKCSAGTLAGNAIPRVPPLVNVDNAHSCAPRRP